MAVAEVKRVELYLHRSVVDDVLARLQEWGHFEVSSDDEARSATEDALKDSGYEARLSDLNYALRFLKNRYDDPGAGLARSLGERPIATLEELGREAASVDLDSLIAQLRAQERHLAELKAGEAADRALLETLYGLSDLPVPLSMVARGTDRVGALLVTGAPEVLTDWSVQLNNELGEDVETRLGLPVGKSNQTPWGLALFLRDAERDVAAVTAKLGLSRYELPDGLEATAVEERNRLEAALAETRQAIKKAEEDLTAFAKAHMPHFQRMHDYYQVLEDRRAALESGLKTRATVVLKGWVQASRAEEFKALLAPYASMSEAVVRDAEEGEEPPIALENPSFARPFETLTMMYGAPKYGSADPSVPMLPFFLLFFGLCYADAGYGLIVTLLSGWVLARYRRMAEGPRRFIKLVFYSGIATTIVGALVGGWFGNTVETFGFLSGLKPLVAKLQVINPMNDPMTMLGFSLALGVVHLFLGLTIALVTNLRRGEWLAAFGDQGGWMTFLIGLLLLAGGTMNPQLKTPGVWVTLVGAVILVLTQGREKPTLIGKAISGVMSLYNVTGYLGDVLSYSRLLALGLVGGVVAMIVNLMSSMVSSTPYVGWLLALLIFLLGHLFSMVINILGAFVHPLRLQYVEFFGKFYESGGRGMEPLRHRSDYVTIGSSEGR